MVGSRGVCVWRESGVRRSVLCWCIWQESDSSHREDVFTFNSHLIHFIKIFYKFCTFSAIFKDKAALNCITAQPKKVYSRQL
jgi:hypothetical protein